MQIIVKFAVENASLYWVMYRKCNSSSNFLYNMQDIVKFTMKNSSSNLL